MESILSDTGPVDETSSFGAAERQAALAHASGRVVDLVVLGGGITGAGVAREAALRGLDVVLLERGDFASGTSSRSSKLIHGGVRYLEQGEIALVREAARERAVLRRIAPHLAEATRMMIPVSSAVSKAKMAAGLFLFDRLAGIRGPEAFDSLNREKTLAAEPGLRPENLYGSVRFTEFRTNDARLVLETVLSAVEAGGRAISRAEVTSVASTDADGVRLTVNDGVHGGELEIRARCMVNAGGPWVDRVLAMSGAPDKAKLQLTRGIHLAVPAAAFPVSHSVVLKTADGRSAFVVPAGPLAYIGTTDTHYTGDPAEPGVDIGDVRYLLEAAAGVFRDAPTAADVCGVWSGVRPLLAQEGKAPSEISRHDEILRGPGPVVSVAGGKLTTYRRMSERVMHSVLEILGVADLLADGASGDRPLVGGDAAAQESGMREANGDGSAGSGGSELSRRLFATYGVRARHILGLIAADPTGADCPGGLPNLTNAEIDYMVDCEAALSLDDILRRRTRLGMLETRAAAAAAEAIARRMSTRLGWSEEKTAAEVEMFRSHAAKELAAVDALVSGG